MADKIFVLLCVFLFCLTLTSLRAEKHSLLYIYTALSKPVDLPGIYEFTAMGLLDDTQIDFYNSKEKRKIPKQQWMKEKIDEDEWRKGSQSRRSKEQWFKKNIHNLINRMRDNESDLHVLQWRVGCDVEQQGDEVKFSKGIYEFSYDGEDFLAFDDQESRWVAPVDAALPTKRKWDNVPIFDQYIKGYTEKECVKWLNKFRENADEELRNVSAPDVHMFARKCSKDELKLKLTCLATGFYFKDVTMTIRKNQTSLPENELNSTVLQPNHDGTFQLRMSVEIEEDEEAEYDCFVSHVSLKEPIINKWDGICKCPLTSVTAGFGGAGIGFVFILAVCALVFCILVKKKYIVIRSSKKPVEDNAGVHPEEGQASDSLNASATFAQLTCSRLQWSTEDQSPQVKADPESGKDNGRSLTV